MIREISQFDTTRLGGGFDHLPSPPQPAGPGDQSAVEEFIRRFTEQQMQDFFDQISKPPGH